MTKLHSKFFFQMQRFAFKFKSKYNTILSTPVWLYPTYTTTSVALLLKFVCTICIYVIHEILNNSELYLNIVGRCVTY